MTFVDKWIKFQAYSEIAGLIFVLVAYLFILLYCALRLIKNKMVVKLLRTNGFKRELFDVPAFGSGAFYGWVRESDGKRIDEREIKGLSYKKIKEKVK